MRNLLKSLSIFILLAFVLISQLQAQDDKKIKGYDLLGLPRFCKEFLNAPKLPYFSVMMRTFGDPIPCIKKRIARGGITDIQIDLRDATCWRNRKCPAGTPKLDDWNDMKSLVSEINPLVKQNPEINWWISPYLEHDIKDKATILKACSVIKNNCPSCKCVNSPFSGVRETGLPLELHGTKVTAWSVSGDGASTLDADNIRRDCSVKRAKQKLCTPFQHRLSGDKFTAAWINEFNLRVTGEKTFTMPKERTCKPTADLFEQVYSVMISPEPKIPTKPAICKTVRRLKCSSGEINKTNAEAYAPCPHKDKRGNRNLLILNKAGQSNEKLDIYSSRGEKVGCFKYYAPFTTPNTYRWYIGDCSGETPAQLNKELKNEWGFVHLGKGDCLVFNSIRRECAYR